MNKSENRVEVVSEITRQLKILAKELNVPVLVLSQLSRAGQQRETKQPQLTDLRESGSIEQDADIVMMLHESKIDEAGKDGKQSLWDKQNKEIAEAKNKVANANGQDTKLVTILIRKNRSGRMGNVPLLFRKDYCRFDSLSEEAETQINAIENERVNYMNNNE